jgi:putative methyltransferase (TIGR04325 family)
MAKERFFLIKQFIPPILIKISKKLLKAKQISISAFQYGWSGNYSSWEEAKRNSTGYDSEIIIDKVKNSLLQVKNGEAVYERDSVLFDEIQYSWGLLAGLQKAALGKDAKLCVLDFGGSLGSTYFQNKEFLDSLKELQWCIVEQPHFVNCGKKHFEHDQLKFYSTIEDCLAKHKPDVLLVSGVLQYLEKPFEWIEKFIGLGIPYIIVDRTSFVESETDILTIQNVPESIYKASYPAWFFNEKKFVSQFKGFSLLGTFESFCDGRIVLNSKLNAKWLGYQFILKQ